MTAAVSLDRLQTLWNPTPSDHVPLDESTIDTIFTTLERARVRHPRNRYPIGDGGRAWQRRLDRHASGFERMKVARRKIDDGGNAV